MNKSRNNSITLRVSKHVLDTLNIERDKTNETISTIISSVLETGLEEINKNKTKNENK
jgi:hypothetical protein